MFHHKIRFNISNDFDVLKTRKSFKRDLKDFRPRKKRSTQIGRWTYIPKKREVNKIACIFMFEGRIALTTTPGRSLG